MRQVLDSVTPKLLWRALTSTLLHRTLAAAVLREKLNGKRSMVFQHISVESVAFDTSIMGSLAPRESDTLSATMVHGHGVLHVQMRPGLIRNARRRLGAGRKKRRVRTFFLGELKMSVLLTSPICVPCRSHPRLTRNVILTADTNLRAAARSSTCTSPSARSTSKTRSRWSSTRTKASAKWRSVWRVG